ncbi:MAG: PilZ domain-containing protein [Novosphingobium sp.]
MAGTTARKEERVDTRIPVKLGIGRSQVAASILDATSRGMLMSSDQPPRRGDVVEIFCGSNVMVGQVRWQRGDRFGVLLGERIDVRGLVQGRQGSLSVAEQRRIEAERVAALKFQEARTVRPYDLAFIAIAMVASIGFLAVFLQRLF